MTQRPYITFGIEALEGLAQSSASNAKVVEDLIVELCHRKNPRAQRLKVRLERLNQLSMSEDVTAVGSDGSRKPATEAGVILNQPSPTVERTSASGAPSSQYASLAHRYECLRATFTVEAELLARWGMTAQLPVDMQELVFCEWNKKLSAGKHEGLSSEALEADRVRIAQERAFLEQSLKALGVREMLHEIPTSFYGDTHD